MSLYYVNRHGKLIMGNSYANSLNSLCFESIKYENRCTPYLCAHIVGRVIVFVCVCARARSDVTL